MQTTTSSKRKFALILPSTSTSPITRKSAPRHDCDSKRNLSISALNRATPAHYHHDHTSVFTTASMSIMMLHDNAAAAIVAVDMLLGLLRDRRYELVARIHTLRQHGKRTRASQGRAMNVVPTPTRSRHRRRRNHVGADPVVLPSGCRAAVNGTQRIYRGRTAAAHAYVCLGHRVKRGDGRYRCSKTSPSIACWRDFRAAGAFNDALSWSAPRSGRRSLTALVARKTMSAAVGKRW